MALRLRGSTSGYAEIDAPAVAGDVTLTLPSTTGTINVKDGSGTTNVGTGVNLGNPGANIFTISNTGGERLRIAADGAVTIPGNLNISGVLTYEDVTSVDAIGLSTFRDGLITKDVGITTITSSDINGDTVTATDVFVYDTSKDSDGGAWRKRTSHTSWYNETLNTQYRGSRREFPAVAVIVAEAEKVTIYDGDDPDLPMWMVFSAANPRGILGWAAINYTRFKVAALNGILTSVSNDGGHLFKFVEDYVEIIYSTTAYPITSSRTIGGRNDPKVSNSSGGATRTYVAVTYAMNDVAMTVLPNAPIDDATGLPIPTIAVATDSGLSIINDDGTVSSPLSGTHVGSTIDISDDFVLYYGNESQGGYYPYDVKTATYISNARFFSANVDGPVSLLENLSNSTNQDIAFTGDDGQSLAIGMDNGLNLIKGNPRDGIADNGMVAYATTSYNTGWMHGDIKGAFLSGISTTNAAVAYSDGFSNNDNGWAFADNGSSTISGGNLVLEQNGNARAYDVDALNGVATGTKLVFTGTVSGSGTGTFIIDDDGAGAGVGGVTNYGSVTSTGSFNFTATKTASNRIRFFRTSGSNNYDISFINITTEYDRSVNAKGLSVYGTVTKTAVATGAELVAYSGFSASNYLKQQYNSDLDFGTGDFSITWWMKITGDISGTGFVFDRRNTGSRFTAYYTSADAGRLYFQTYQSSGNGESQMYAENIDNYKDTWTCYTLTRSGNTMVIYINGKVGYQATLDVRDVDDAAAQLYIGVRHNEIDAVTQGELSLMRFSKSVPSPEQIKKMYEDEKVLFQENAACTLYGSSDAVTALAFDEVTDQLHVGTSSGRSDFQGLRRINNTTTAVTTAISAHDTFIIEQ